MLFDMNAEGNLCRQVRRVRSCEAKKHCETSGLVDNELSKMHETEVHVFSESVFVWENKR